MKTPADLTEDLRRLGVRAGQAVTVHASLRRIGPVEGGPQGVIAAFLLSLTMLSGYVSRVGFVGALGVLAALSTSPSLTIWYRFPANYTLATMFIDIVGYVVAGLVIAAILKPRAAAA